MPEPIAETFDSDFFHLYDGGDFSTFTATLAGSNWFGAFLQLNNYLDTTSTAVVVDADAGVGRHINYLDLGYNSDVDLISTNIALIVTAAGGAIHDLSLGSGWSNFIELNAARNVVGAGSGSNAHVVMNGATNIFDSGSAYTEYLDMSGARNTVTIEDGWVVTLKALGSVSSIVNVTGDGWVHEVETGDGNDRVTVNGAEVVLTGAGNDTVTVNGFVRLVNTSDGDDRIVANDTIEYIKAGDGDDVIETSATWINKMHLGGGDDTVIVNELAAWSDIMIHGSGNSANGSDTLDFSNLRQGVEFDLGGGIGYQEIYRSASIDAWVGASGMENIIGTRRGDILGSSSADNEMTGGRGRDVFVFGQDEGADVITDFGRGDRIQIEGHTGGFATLDISDDVIHLGSGTIDLVGVDVTALTASDFIFV